VTLLLRIDAGILGLLVGSFLNVVIWRVPRGESVVRPGSHCPRCDAPLRPLDNIPVLSWLILRGRCRHCQAPINPRYPLVELLTAVLFLVVTWRLGLVAELPAYLYLIAVGVALSVIDLDLKRLPNALTLPSYPVLAVLLGLASVIHADWWALVRAVAGMAAYYGVLFVLAVAIPKGMGFGDVKLAGVLGMALGWLGWAELISGFFLAFLYGAVVSLVLIAVRRAGRKSTVPFGPFLVAGAITAILGGQQLVTTYLDLTLG
jgi:leader peptidase (prepilin peptidase)/N-methyltransferase